MAEDDAALKEHLAEVLQREAVAHTLKHHESDDIARILGPAQNAATALVELPATVAAAKAPVTPGRAVPPLRSGRGAAVDAFHPGLQAALIRPGAYARPPQPTTHPQWRER
jgi:hypothetical protein